MPAWLQLVFCFGVCIVGIALIGIPQRIPLIRRIPRDSELESATIFLAVFLVVAGALGMLLAPPV